MGLRTSESRPAWWSSFRALIENLGCTLAHTKGGEDSIALRAQHQGLGTPHSATRALQLNMDAPSSQTPHGGAETLTSQLPCPAGGGTGGSPPHILAPVLGPALASCSENKGPEAPAEPSEAESSGFRSLLTRARATHLTPGPAPWPHRNQQL